MTVAVSIKRKHPPGKLTQQPDVIDLLLTRNLQSAHVVDFNPFLPKTDSLLFTYEELQTEFSSALDNSFIPEFRVIDSRSHPLANVNAPLYQNNMLPLDVLALSHGHTGQGFAERFAEAVQEANAN